MFNIENCSFNDIQFEILVRLAEREDFLIMNMAGENKDFPIIFSAGKELEETGLAYVEHDCTILRNRICRGNNYDSELFTNEVKNND